MNNSHPKNPVRIQLTEAETTALINQASGARYLSLDFGPGFVALNTERSPWALEALREMRQEGSKQ